MASDSYAPCPKCGTWHDVEQPCIVCMQAPVRQEAALPAPEE